MSVPLPFDAINEAIENAVALVERFDCVLHSAIMVLSLYTFFDIFHLTHCCFSTSYKQLLMKLLIGSWLVPLYKPIII